VDAFNRLVTECADRRRNAMVEFVARFGAVTRRDMEERSPRYRAFLETETSEDLRILEAMWDYRDVVGVLLRGAQGTRFEGAIWAITDREVERIKENFDQFQDEHACRTDIPPDVFASTIVGAYLLLGMRMSRMSEKPDLAEWARSLNTLIREGSVPVEPNAAPSAPRRDS